jgi:protein TonB
LPAAVPVAESPAGVPDGSLTQHPSGTVGGVDHGVAGGVVGGAGTGPIPVGAVAHPPVLMRRVQPAYPQAARRQGIEGLVLLEAVLDRDGRVEPEIKILQSIQGLDAEAIAAVRQWYFRPARDRSGATRRVILEIPIRFVLR